MILPGYFLCDRCGLPTLSTLGGLCVRCANVEVRERQTQVAISIDRFKTAAKAVPPATDRQEGGDHYAKMTIQPIDFITGNNIPFIEGNVIKYVCRWRDKGGIEDLRKARHYLDMLIERQEKPAA